MHVVYSAAVLAKGSALAEEETVAHAAVQPLMSRIYRALRAVLARHALVALRISHVIRVTRGICAYRATRGQQVVPLP